MIYSSYIVSTLCATGLRENEANQVIVCAKNFGPCKTTDPQEGLSHMFDLQLEFMMFFISWANQGRRNPFEEVLREWKMLWGNWWKEAKLLNIDPRCPHPYHRIMIEKLYARHGVAFCQSGLPRQKKPRRLNLPTIEVA